MAAMPTSDNDHFATESLHQGQDIGAGEGTVKTAFDFGPQPMSHFCFVLPSVQQLKEPHIQNTTTTAPSRRHLIGCQKEEFRQIGSNFGQFIESDHPQSSTVLVAKRSWAWAIRNNEFREIIELHIQ